MIRGLGYIFAVLVVVALAAWAYGQTNRTLQAAAEARALRREIVELTRALEMQRAEWAYLNRPERLRQLVDLNFDRLGLVPFTGDRFGSVDEVVYPLPASPHANQTEQPHQAP